ncbi:MAG: hypothetical protein JW785_07300 [Acidimicrobiia bacterium]|nr:hypothetical protein [Acidimicrobiia bacterium]
MIAGTRLGIALLVIVLGLAACGGEGEEAAPTGSQATTSTAEAAGTTTTQEAPAETTHATFPSGASVDYPADWISFGVGASSGSLELAIPETANVSLRDAAASEYLYGPLFADADSLPGAMDMLAALLGANDVVAEAFTSDGGREILYAIAAVNGAESLFAVTRSELAYASVFAPSLAGPLSPDTATTILRVFASITP